MPEPDPQHKLPTSPAAGADTPDPNQSDRLESGATPVPDFTPSSLFGPDLQPQAKLIELLEHLGIAHDGTLSGIHGATQAVMRDINSVMKGERAPQIQTPAMVHATDIESLATEPLSEKTRELLGELGLFDRLDAPQDGIFDGAVGFGGRAGRVAERLLHLADQWNERGVRFDTLVLTGSSRAMNPDYDETPEDLLALTEGSGEGGLPATEGEMMVWLVKNHPGLPEEWRDGSVRLYQKVAANRSEAGGRSSAGTLETVRANFVLVPTGSASSEAEAEEVNGWAELGNSFLAASSQPYTLRQVLSLAGAFMDEGSPELSVTGIGDLPFEDKEASFVIELAKLIDTEVRFRRTVSGQ